MRGGKVRGDQESRQSSETSIGELEIAYLADIRSRVWKERIYSIKKPSIAPRMRRDGKGGAEKPVPIFLIEEGDFEFINELDTNAGLSRNFALHL